MKRIIITCLSCILSTIVFSEEDKISACFLESYTLEERGAFEEAAKTIETCYIDGNYEQNLRTGWLYYKAKNYKKSDRYYKKAIEVMPYAIEAKLGATLPLGELGKWEKVKALYKEILLIDNKNYKALYYLGLIWYNSDEYKKAFPLFSELNNLYPTDYNTMLMSAWCNYKLGKNRDAKAIIKRLLHLYPNDKSGQELMQLL